MAKKLYVGNLPYSVTDESLKELFSQVGAVDEAVVIKYNDTGRSKGFGFVTMSNDDDASKAIEMYHLKEIDGRKLNVNEARPKTDRAGGNFGNQN